MSASQWYSPADIILQQLGGRNRLKRMIGAKDFYSDDGGYSLTFNFSARAKKGIKYITITLTPADLYDVTYTKITNKKCKITGIKIPSAKVVAKDEGICADMMKDCIESKTGLYLSI